MTQDTPLTRRRILKTGLSTGVFGMWAGAVAAAEPAANSDLNDLRRATAKYHDLETALEDGYVLPEDHCVSHPDPTVDAAMGYHYVNPALLDESVNPTEPEVLVYEQRGDRRHLVAVEFLATGENPPTLFGHQFHPFPGSQADWALHAWIWTDNPDGLFAAFNPRVDCPD